MIFGGDLFPIHSELRHKVINVAELYDLASFFAHAQ